MYASFHLRMPFLLLIVIVLMKHIIIVFSTIWTWFLWTSVLKCWHSMPSKKPLLHHPSHYPSKFRHLWRFVDSERRKEGVNNYNLFRFNHRVLSQAAMRVTAWWKTEMHPPHPPRRTTHFPFSIGHNFKSQNKSKVVQVNMHPTSPLSGEKEEDMSFSLIEILKFKISQNKSITPP